MTSAHAGPPEQLRSTGPALIGHPDAELTSITEVGRGHLGSFYAVTVSGSEGHFGGMVLLVEDEPYTERGVAAAEAFLSTLTLSEETPLKGFVGLLDHLEALPPGFDTNSIDTRHPSGAGASLTHEPLELVLYAVRRDSSTAVTNGIGSAEGFTTTSYLKATLTRTDSGLAWTVVDAPI